MMPFYKPGDHVLTLRWMKYAAGDVIVFESEGKNYIKRIKKISGRVFTACGDNLEESAANYKREMNDIKGKVILKY